MTVSLGVLLIHAPLLLRLLPHLFVNERRDGHFKPLVHRALLVAWPFQTAVALFARLTDTAEILLSATIIGDTPIARLT